MPPRYVFYFQGENGVLELFVEGSYADTFEISPAVVENSAAQFVISVKNSRKLDYEKAKSAEFKIVAREVGSSELSASALVTVNLIDANDNAPVFDSKKYSATVHENDPNGKVVLKVSESRQLSVLHDAVGFFFTGPQTEMIEFRVELTVVG